MKEEPNLTKEFLKILRGAWLPIVLLWICASIVWIGIFYALLPIVKSLMKH